MDDAIRERLTKMVELWEEEADFWRRRVEWHENATSDGILDAQRRAAAVADVYSAHAKAVRLVLEAAR